MEHSKHLWRAFILVLLGVVGFAVVRFLLIPDSYGVYGSFRADDVTRQAGKPVVHGQGNQECASCHDEEYEALASGKHRTLLCEGCHGPLSQHVTDGDKVGDMPVARHMETCLRCHQHLVARPPGFPQVDLEEHLKDMEVDITPDACFNCHGPHSPAV